MAIVIDKSGGTVLEVADVKGVGTLSIIKSSSPPSSPPSSIGRLYVYTDVEDVNDSKAYISIGTESVSDWKRITVGAFS